jgi:hypothetical protein
MKPRKDVEIDKASGQEIFKKLPANAKLIATDDYLKLYKIGDDYDGAIDNGDKIFRVHWYSALAHGYWKPVEDNATTDGKKYDITAIEQIRFDVG